MSMNQDSPDKSEVESVVSTSIQEPSPGLDANASTGKVDKPHQCIVISLIRHAQCYGNAHPEGWEADDSPNPLTETGRRQADSLGKDWADTHIDHLLSSPLQRAHDTAKALSSHNTGHPEIITNPLLVERRYGDKVYQLMQWNRTAATEELRGTSSYDYVSRTHSPADGGESMSMVAARAHAIIRMILKDYAVNLSEAPECFLEKKTTDTPADLPDGIPHIVIVSHNVFLMELYEKLYSWGRAHVETECNWRNAEWSRHMLWYDGDSDTMEVVDMKYCGKTKYY